MDQCSWIFTIKRKKKDIFIYFKIVSKEIPSKITPNKEIVNYSIQNGWEKAPKV